MQRHGLVVAAGLLAVVVLSCSSSPSSPNKTPGQCVLSHGIWYCGTGYGDFPQCPWQPGQGLGSPCDFDAGLCFDCSYGGVAGATCDCSRGDAGEFVWQCNPSGTGCSQ